MSLERDIELIDGLCANPAEMPWVEFKRDNADPEMIGVRCSALSNAARMEGKDCAYMLWGITDDTHAVVGTDFYPETKKIGNQEFQLWLAQHLKPSIVFNFRTVDHPGGRVVILKIPAATSAPVAFKNIPYIRIGSATPKLMDYPERYQRLIDCLRPYTWEHGIARQYASGDDVLGLLDYTQYFRLTEQPLPDNRTGIFERLEADRLIKRDVGDRWNITNLGAILFATDLGNFDPGLARKAVRFVAYDGNDRAAPVTHRRDSTKGYANGFEGLVGYINDLLPRNEHIGEALRSAHPLFPELAIRELVANALIHQDMTVTGAGPQIELFEDRIEITNPGPPLVQADRMIDLPPRSRNEALASLMRRMGICEEQGSGLDKVIAQVELFQLPPPLFREDAASMQVILYGPRTFAYMTQEERIRACYHHAVL
ncbi:MAG: putative DNA binding domain-containing protein, partial [Rhodospirillaceae bacterium]|nr:putative DNA binding domain-containing protein [Rhodospirillaceae bacterium]